MHAEGGTPHAAAAGHRVGKGEGVYAGAELPKGEGGVVAGPVEPNVILLGLEPSFHAGGVGEGDGMGGGGGGMVFGHERPAPFHRMVLSYIRSLFSCCSSEPHSQALDDDILNPSHTRVKRPGRSSLNPEPTVTYLKPTPREGEGGNWGLFLGLGPKTPRGRRLESGPRDGETTISSPE